MAKLVWDREVECMPLPELVELCERKFRESKVMERAARSALYRQKWAAAGVVPEQVRTYADLRKVPYTTGHELREAQTRYHPDELVCSDSVRLWISTSGTTGTPKWIPIGEGDLKVLREIGPRITGLTMGVAEGYSFLSLAAPAPFVSESGMYTGMGGRLLGDQQVEFTFLTLPETADALNFARMAEVQGLFLAPSMALVIAEGISTQAAAEARARFRKQRNLRNLLGVLVTSMVKIKAKNVLKFKWGIFGGEPVDPYRRPIVDAYGLEPYSAYSATELYTCRTCDCEAHDGIHFYMDVQVVEIIPQEELEKEEADAAYVPQATPLWEAPAGLSGELVVTNFADALPLIRYRISDLVRVVSTEPCTCGRTHPRIDILHRSDDIINLGLIRFSIYLLKQKLEGVGMHGQIAKWQLRVTREDYKPKALLLVQPKGETNAQAFVKEIRDKIDEIEGVPQGWKHGLIAEPEVRLVEELTEERTALGKVKLAIYEDVYFKEG